MEIAIVEAIQHLESTLQYCAFGLILGMIGCVFLMAGINK